MAGNIVARFFGGHSIYESLREHEVRSDGGFNDEPEPFEDGDVNARMEAGRAGERHRVPEDDNYHFLGFDRSPPTNIRNRQISNHQIPKRVRSEADSPNMVLLPPSTQSLNTETSNRPAS